MTNAVERLTTTIGLDDWWAGPDALPTPEAAAVVAQSYDETNGAEALDRLSNALDALNTATAEAGVTVSDATRYMADNWDVSSMVETIVMIQDLRRRLDLVADHMTRHAAYAAIEGEVPREGHLLDGRTWSLKRGSNRKAWDHNGWKHDARAKVVEKAGIAAELVDPGTGETVNVLDLLAQVQEVHGSTSPRVGQLKGLGLDPGDYCETSPGLWGVQCERPDDTGGTPS